jgi:hypothetical protein
MRFRLTHRFRMAAFGAAGVARVLTATACARGCGERQRSRQDGLPLDPIALIEPVVAP